MKNAIHMPPVDARKSHRAREISTISAHCPKAGRSAHSSDNMSLGPNPMRRRRTLPPQKNGTAKGLLMLTLRTA